MKRRRALLEMVPHLKLGTLELKLRVSIQILSIKYEFALKKLVKSQSGHTEKPFADH